MLNLVEKFTPAIEADTDDAGLTTVEYAVAAAVIAAVVTAAFNLLGNTVSAKIDEVNKELNRHRLLGGGAFGVPQRALLSNDSQSTPLSTTPVSPPSSSPSWAACCSCSSSPSPRWHSLAGKIAVRARPMTPLAQPRCIKPTPPAAGSGITISPPNTATACAAGSFASFPLTATKSVSPPPSVLLRRPSDQRFADCEGPMHSDDP